MAPRFGIVLSLSGALLLVGCFEVRALDKRFDAGAIDGAPPLVDTGAEAGPECAALDKNCDGIDEDCDGRYDEDFAEASACGIGQCRAESAPARCVSGFPIECLPGASTGEECDGLDNDCDGLTDEDLVRGCGERIGECTRGQSSCIGGQWTECDGVEPTEETCDGRDEDCDGEVDEAVQRACDGPGLCGEGIEPCRDGEWLGCDAEGGSDEVCNGVDDDCDGLIDEDQSPRRCGDDTGLCQSGMQACEGGGWGECEGAVGPAPIDACDGEDDDCDGSVDEGDGPCGACSLESRPVCPVGVDPCPEAPSITLCITELGRVEGGMGQQLGWRLVPGGDIDEDGIDDFVASGTRAVRAISGQGGGLWNRDDAGQMIESLTTADLGEDGRREVIVGDLGDGQGEVIVLGPGGGRQDGYDGRNGVRLGSTVAAVDGEPFVLAGAPEANDEQGLVRRLRFADRRFEQNWFDLDVEGSLGLGGVMALAPGVDGRELLAVTSGPAGERAVFLITDPLDAPDGPAIEVIPSGRGVGDQLLIGELLAGAPPALAALNAVQPWVDLVVLPLGGDAQEGIRLPLDDVGAGLALMPSGQAGQPPLLVVLTDERVHLIRIGPEGSAAVVELQLPPDDQPPGMEARPTVAAAARGPDGSRLLAIGQPGSPDAPGRVIVYRVQ